MVSLFLLSVSFTVSYGATHADSSRLHRHLMTNYSTRTRPTFNLSEPTEVHIGFRIFSVKEFEEKTGKFSVFGVFSLHWIDFQLEWIPGDYGGIERMFFTQNEIWKPDLLLMNPYGKVEPPGFGSLKVGVFYDGNVSWAPSDMYEIMCPADVTYYPFDQQSCTFIFKIYMHSLSEVFVVPTFPYINTDFYSPNSIWDVKSAAFAIASHGDTQQMKLNIVINRRPMFRVINTIVPFCVLGLLNIMVFLLPAESGERVGFSVTVLLAIAVFMTIVADTLPDTSEPSVPRFCYLLTADLGINMLVTMSTILILKFHHKPQHETIPFWLVHIICKCACQNVKTQKGDIKKKENIDFNNENIRSEPAASIICVNAPTETDMDGRSDYSHEENGRTVMNQVITWQDFAKYLENIFFIFFIVLYVTSKVVAFFVLS
ncbi:acetylcholine receptor subunit beta-like [Argopecten irradians]|uniref:acetylcholine receptor subunit beta-like n=1 Tax=Argopecten irradians TaxID=31199 RepID=UPI003710493A